MADYNLIITSSKAFNNAIDVAIQESEEKLRLTREKISCLHEEFESNVAEGLNMMKESTIKISLENDELKKQMIENNEGFQVVRAENDQLKSKYLLVNSFVDAWQAQRKSIQPENGQVTLESENATVLRSEVEAIQKENAALATQNSDLLSQNTAQQEMIQNLQSQSKDSNLQCYNFVQVELENKKLQLQETKLLEVNANLRAQIQIIKQRYVESQRIDHDLITMKHFPEKNIKITSSERKVKKESHAKRTQRVLRSRITEMNEKIADTEACLEKYTESFSHNLDLTNQIKELQEENSYLKQELNLMKAKCEEMESLAEKFVKEKADSEAKIDAYEKENLELKAELKKVKNMLVSSKSTSSGSPEIEAKQSKIEDENIEIDMTKNEKVSFMAKIKKLHNRFLNLLRSGSWVFVDQNTIEITATLSEVTEIVTGFEQLA